MRKTDQEGEFEEEVERERVRDREGGGKRE